MGLGIGTNIAALHALRGLEVSSARVDAHLLRLGTGLRVARAADDPDGLARTERIQARLRSTWSATRNVQDAIGLLRTLDQALDEVQGIAARMRELALRAANGTLSEEDRATLDAEHQGLARELTSIAASTHFNGLGLLDTERVVTFHVGPEATDTVEVQLLDYSVVGGVLAAYSLTDEDGREEIGKDADLLHRFVGGMRGELGAVERRLQQVLGGLWASQEALTGTRGRIRDADLAAETAGLSKARILQGIGLVVLARANLEPRAALRLLETPEPRERAARAPRRPDERPDPCAV